MTSTRAIVLVTMLALATGALAQGPDTIGLWFDTDYTVNIINPPPAPLVAYLVLHEPSAAQIAAASFQLVWPDPTVIVLATSWNGGPVVQFDGGCALIGYGTPLPTLPETLLATYTILVVSQLDNGLVRILACSGDACPFYSDGSQAICMDTPYDDGVVACIGNCSVAAEARTWSSVKSLY
ncbi:MAG: hypothetical protein R3D98_11845 [Candidatus Krumholzibacteriia bacterium]